MPASQPGERRARRSRPPGRYGPAGCRSSHPHRLRPSLRSSCLHLRFQAGRIVVERDGKAIDRGRPSRALPVEQGRARATVDRPRPVVHAVGDGVEFVLRVTRQLAASGRALTTSLQSSAVNVQRCAFVRPFNRESRNLRRTLPLTCTPIPSCERNALTVWSFGDFRLENSLSTREHWAPSMRILSGHTNRGDTR